MAMHKFRRARSLSQKEAICLVVCMLAVASTYMKVLLKPFTRSVNCNDSKSSSFTLYVHSAGSLWFRPNALPSSFQFSVNF